jgi:DNA-binding response OmpR family regulator
MEGTSATILLAEDQGTVAAPIAARLNVAGHRVHWVKTIREARVELVSRPWDVLLLDTSLETDGLEFFQAIRFAPEHPSAGVVMLVEAGDVHARERAQQLGAAAVVTKPVEPGELAGVVGDLLAFL